MKIEWRGHACFVVKCAGKVIVMDPFDESYGYAPIRDAADLVTVSHDHHDHNASHLLSGSPPVIKQAGETHFGEITIQGIRVFHDKKNGALRGPNIIFKISAEGINLVHLGDLGHVLSKEHIGLLGRVDVLLLPVGGNYTIDAGDAFEVYQQLHPAVVIPMHYKTPACTLPIAPVEAFISKFDRVIKKPFLEIDKKDLPGEKRVVVLDYGA